MDPGSGDPGEIVYSGLPGNTVGMATMVDMSETSKQKCELWAADVDAQSRTAEDLTITELTTPVPGRNAHRYLSCCTALLEPRIKVFVSWKMVLFFQI